MSAEIQRRPAMSATDQTQMTALAQAGSIRAGSRPCERLREHRAGQLLALYLPADLYAHLQPSFDRGELAGGAVDDWALEADRNPPTLEMRNRAGQEVQRMVSAATWRRWPTSSASPQPFRTARTCCS